MGNPSARAVSWPRLAFLWDLDVDITVFLVLVGLGGSDGKAYVAIEFHHGQFCHLAHGGAVLFDTDEKIYIWLFEAVSDEIIAFKSAICDDERLLRECVTFQHIHQRANFVFLRLWLNDQVGKGAAENVIQRRDMKLIYAFGNTIVLNEGRGGRITREVTRRPVHRQQAISTEQIAVSTICVEVCKNGTEHLRRDLSATLTECGRGNFNICVMQNLS